MANAPKHRIQVGRGVVAAIWSNEVNINGRKSVMLKVSVERRYKDPSTGAFRSSTSFGIDEVPRVQLALARAYEYIINESTAKAEDAVVEEELVA